MNLSKYITNNLFTTYTLEVEFPSIYDFDSTKDKAREVFTKIKDIYNATTFKNQNEHQFEDDFILKALNFLGWCFVRQDEKIIQGRLEKPDFLLFCDENQKSSYETIDKIEKRSTNEFISVVLESKAYGIELDNKKVKDNPHFQILRYLSNLKLDFGFLTNGRKWRFYDNSKLSSQKIFYEINLEEIIKDDAFEAFLYFYHIFNVKNFSKEMNEQNIQHILSKNLESKIAIEDDLRSVIYGINGRDSLFEKIGTCIYEANPNATTDEIYQNSLYFIFRLLFIAYFEDKFSHILEKHIYFQNYVSLYNLSVELKNLNNKEHKTYIGIGKLEDIFRIYNKGKPNFDMPIFNGGLFDEENTPLLNAPKIFDDETMQYILESLFCYQGKNSLFKRDYRTLSVAHLGTIYEGLLSYFFEVAQEDIFYLIYSSKGSKDKTKSIEGYFDSYDYANISKAENIHRFCHYEKGKLYLKNTSNSRKSSASFYTPQSITEFLVKEGLKDTLNDSNILRFKILDNACGSGHFLVEALNAITEIIIADFDNFPKLKNIFEEEKKLIAENICQFIQDYTIDDSDIIKRLILKRVIFGVDLNPFSIELTKLSLWIDSFIFGTPLSFLEHHIKCGNALVGTNIASFNAFTKETQGNIFIQNTLNNEFESLKEVFKKLDSIRDSTEQEIIESKRLYKEEIKPSLEKINLYLNFLNAKKFAKDEELQCLSIVDIDGLDSNTDAKKIIQAYNQKYRFFNYEIEFPEILEGDFMGFQMIIGNPPWDKTKFSDLDFFPQFVSNYRTLSNSKKKIVENNCLTKEYIKAKYDSQKEYMESLNNYLKSAYPLNEGSGDGNLFRFFVEKNLSLLAKNATLNYVLPSALMFEEGSYKLRENILKQKELVYFYSFENREGIFGDVDMRYKFALMQIKNAKTQVSKTIATMFYKTNINEIYKKENILEISFKDIIKISPNSLALCEIRSQKDLEILKKCYSAFSQLSPCWLDFRNELHMTNDKDLFIERYRKDLLPLYEGKMIHQFCANFQKAQYFLDKSAFDDRLRSKEIYRLKQDLSWDAKKYDKYLDNIFSEKKKEDSTLTKEKVEDTFIIYDREFFRLGYRKIASDTNERTGIFSLIPKNVGCGENMWQSIPKYYFFDSRINFREISHLRLLFALGILNSIIVDYLLRGMVQINVSKTYLQRIPMPQPSDKEILTNEVYKEIAMNALRLQLYNDKEDYFGELKEEFKIDKIPNTAKNYDILRAKNDKLIAKLYGITQEEITYILGTFKVLNNKNPGFIGLFKSLDSK